MNKVYKGNITINEIDYPYTLADYIFTVVIGNWRDIKIGWQEIDSIIDRGWIHVFDTNQNELFLKVENASLNYRSDEYSYRILGFIRIFHFYPFTKGKSQFQCNALTFKHPIIDFFLRKDKTILDRAIYLLNLWKEDNANLEEVPSRKTFQINLDEIAYTLCFETMSYFDYFKPFPFDIFSTLSIKSKTDLTIDNVWNIAVVIKLFLQLVSHSRVVDLNEIMLDPEFGNNQKTSDSQQKYNTTLYIRPDKEKDIDKDSVLTYEAIEQGIESIFKQIIDNQICFRSLFNYSENEITTHDIMNVCAAFEAQFSSTNPKFIDKEQRAIKKKMVKDLESFRENYAPDELSYFDKILNGLRLYNDTLKSRLEIALNEFVRIYGEEDVKFGFSKDYSLLPERMRNTRNALDHGDNKYRLTTAMFKDTELLRAIIYMLILQEAKIDDANIRECLNKLSRFPI